MAKEEGELGVRSRFMEFLKGRGRCIRRLFLIAPGSLSKPLSRVRWL